MKDYDYAQNGAYFVTICTVERKQILSKIICNDKQKPEIYHTDIGREIEKSITYINDNYITVDIVKHVIMPNHVHMIVLLLSTSICDDKASMSLQSVIGNFKSFTTKRYNDIQKTNNRSLWQRSYYDRIIRDEQEYNDVWRYIDENPLQWEVDEYYR